MGSVHVIQLTQILTHARYLKTVSLLGSLDAKDLRTYPGNMSRPAGHITMTILSPPLHSACACCGSGVGGATGAVSRPFYIGSIESADRIVLKGRSNPSKRNMRGKGLPRPETQASCDGPCAVHTSLMSRHLAIQHISIQSAQCNGHVCSANGRAILK